MRESVSFICGLSPQINDTDSLIWLHFFVFAFDRIVGRTSARRFLIRRAVVASSGCSLIDLRGDLVEALLQRLASLFDAIYAVSGKRRANVGYFPFQLAFLL